MGVGPGLGSGESTSQVSHVPSWQVSVGTGDGQVGCHFSPAGLLRRAMWDSSGCGGDWLPHRSAFFSWILIKITYNKDTWEVYSVI